MNKILVTALLKTLQNHLIKLPWPIKKLDLGLLLPLPFSFTTQQSHWSFHPPLRHTEAILVLEPLLWLVFLQGRFLPLLRAVTPCSSFRSHWKCNSISKSNFFTHTHSQTTSLAPNPTLFSS